ncbi:amidase, partial [Lyngbya sp. CCY1209]|nr:amidase [Lyngbya sp. CCY1209]
AIVLGQSLEVANSYLRDFATSPEFQAKMQLAFGNHKIWDKADLINFPTIEIRPASEINNAKGAFAAATNTIYLSQELVDENSGNVNAIA